MPPPLRMKLYLHSKIGGSEFVELSEIEKTLKLIPNIRKFDDAVSRQFYICVLHKNV